MVPSSFWRRTFTLTEMIITVLIISFLMGYAWKIWLGGRETTRHTLSQSQIQSDSRIFLDHLARDVAAAYRFYTVNPAEKKFGFYSFQITRTPSDEIFFNTLNGAIKPADEYAINVLKIEYAWSTDGTVKRSQVPGYLKFIRNPMVFTEGPAAQYSGTENEKFEKVVLRDVADFDFKPYQQVFKRTTTNPTEPPKVQVVPVTATDPKKATLTTFITLRIHNKIDEVGNRRDEELDLVGKFYSRVRLAEAAYPGYFCTTDEYKTF
ncbi:MAG: hypothetical protein GX442_16880 [Candidatus Riflebacteria bacterium]|nr:hypothetical protein [Candidatus Riflebacteria bacterium]